MKSNNTTRPLLSAVLAAIVLFSAGTAIATTPSNTIKKIIFDSGDSYSFTVENDNLTWKGLTGDDKGLVSKNHVKHIAFSKHVDIYQWIDNNTGGFITLMIDQQNHEAVCSSLSKGYKEWFVKGQIVNL